MWIYAHIAWYMTIYQNAYSFAAIRGHLGFGMWQGACICMIHNASAYASPHAARYKSGHCSTFGASVRLSFAGIINAAHSVCHCGGELFDSMCGDFCTTLCPYEFLAQQSCPCARAQYHVQNVACSWAMLD